MRTALALVLLLAAAASRAEDPSPPAAPNRRAIAGHEFLPNADVPAPVAVSEFGMTDKLSYGNATGQKYDSSGNPTGETANYEFGGMVMGVHFQSTLGDSFVLRGGFNVSLFSGTNGPSALVVGTTIQPGVQLGVGWSHPLGEQLRFGIGVDYDNSPQLNILVMAAILKALQSGSVADAGLFAANNVTTWIPAATLAWVPHRAIGLVGKVGYMSSSLELAGGTVRREAIPLGLSADLDLRAFWASVPMGVSLTYSDSIPIGNSIAGIRDANLGLMYNGNSSIAVGAVLGNQVLKIRPQYPEPLKTNSPYLTIVLRAFWI